jgi:parvulin-like peptidyl-prolyl isomerase
MKLGLSEKDYTGLFEYQLLQQKVQDAITADVPRTETQVWARHILLSDEATALNIIEKLKNGGDFAALAQEFSQDTGSAVNGGDLGWFGTGAMVPEFETAAFALEKTGDYTTTPVQSQFGFHIIQLIAKQDRPLSADQYESAKNQAFSEWLTKAREEYGVETFDIWKEYVPTEPNFITMMTEAANAQNTAVAEEAKATATPAP